MKIVELEQNSPEWLVWRRSKIMATDASVIIGSNPWKNSLQLWREKLGLDAPQPDNERMTRGRNLEPIARKLVEGLILCEFEPVVIEHETESWAAASLDGYNADNRLIIEIKANGSGNHIAATQKIVPEYYQAQIQWQLFVSGAREAYYCSYMPEYEQEPLVLINVKANYQEEMLKKCWNFYSNNLCAMCPPEEWKLKK